MSEKNSPMNELIGKLRRGLSFEDGKVMDMDSCLATLDEIEREADECRQWVSLGVQLYHQFKESIISRARAIESLTAEKGIYGEVIDLMESAGNEYDRLIKIKSRIDREFNRTFNYPPPYVKEKSAGFGFDLSEFKCGAE